MHKATAAAILLLVTAMPALSSTPIDTWKNFVDHPSEESSQLLMSDLSSCDDNCIGTISSLPDDVVLKMRALLDHGNVYASEIALIVKTIKHNEGEIVEDLDRGLGQAITADPAQTLRIMQRYPKILEYSLETIVVLTSEDTIDDVPLWRFELNRRKQALSSVTDISVIALRDRSLQILENYLARYASLPDDAGGRCNGKPCH